MQSLAVPAQPKIEEKDTLTMQPPIVHRHEIIRAFKCTVQPFGDTIASR